jgi:hypothetical protein
MAQMVESSRDLNGFAEKMRDLLRRFDTGRSEARSES